MTTSRFSAAFFALCLALWSPQGMMAAEEAKSDVEKQLAELREKVEKNPESRLAHVALGKMLYENGHGLEAMKVLKTALDIKTANPDAPLSLVMTNLGQCLETERQLRLAIKVYETALEEEKKERAVPGSFGPGYREAIQEYLDKAKASKDKAIKYFETASKLRSQGKRIEAVAEIQKCLALAVDFGDVWRVQGEILAEAGRHEPAAVSFQQALNLFPRDGETLTLLGRSLLQLRKLPEAAEAFQKALAIDPANTVAIDGLRMATATQAGQK